MYPAFAVLQALKNEIPSEIPLSVLWIGSEGGMEADLVSRAGITFDHIPAAGLHAVGVRALPGNAARLLRGYRKAKEILKQYQPDVLFFTGGYIAAPVAVAGRGIPALTFVPDIEPGLAIKFLRQFSDRIALSVAESEQYFPGNSHTFVSGYPVRPDLQVINKKSALDYFKLGDDLPVLFVMGGSSGARSINQALIQALPDLVQKMCVIHISGRLDWPAVSEKQKEYLKTEQIGRIIAERYRVYPYMHEEIGAAYSAADLILSRAGASILGELPFYRLPAILVPYPYAWRYQKLNADYLAQRGAAEIVLDHELPAQLVSTVMRLLSNSKVLGDMRQAMSHISRPDAAKTIAESLFKLGIGSSGRRRTS